MCSGSCRFVLWSLLLVITVKYLVIVVRADNHGEGGILALAALVVGPGRSRRNLGLLPIVVVILIGPFAVQRTGTEVIGLPPNHGIDIGTTSTSDNQRPNALRRTTGELAADEDRC